jgi:hypothetical protein
MDFATGVFLPEPPPLLGYCLGWSSNFVGWSVKLLQTMVSSHIPHSLPATHCLNSLDWLIANPQFFHHMKEGTKPIFIRIEMMYFCISGSF